MFMAHALDVVLALAAGDFAAAEAAAERAHASETDEDSPYRAGVYGMQMYAIRRAQGRLAEVAPIVRQVAATRERGSIWQPGLAALYVELGMREAARGVFDELARDEFAAVARDAIWPACLTFLAETCVALGDVDRAAALYDELAVYHSRNLMVGLTICFGPADRLLGGLAAVLGRVDDAEEHFRAALALAEGSCSPLWVAEGAVRLGGDARGPRRARAGCGSAPPGIDHRPLARHRPVDQARAARTAGTSNHARGASRRHVGTRARDPALRGRRAVQPRDRDPPVHQPEHRRQPRAVDPPETGCANRTEAASYAVRSGLTGSEPVR
jgi:tetratricopeptide (TPR) repeat protein